MAWDGVQMIRSSAEVESPATQVESTDGVYLVPFCRAGRTILEPACTRYYHRNYLGNNLCAYCRAALESPIKQWTW